MFKLSKNLCSLLSKTRTIYLRTPKIALPLNNFSFSPFSTITDKKLEKVHELKFNDDFNQITAHKGSLVLDFYANWCGPCKRLKPVLTQKANSSEQKWNLVCINIDEFPDLAESYQVQAVPTVVLLQDGKIVDKFVGFPQEDKLNAFYAKANSYTVK